MEPADAAELKTVLVGVGLPAQKPDLLEYAVQQRAEPGLLDALSSLSDEKRYESLDEVIEDLLRVQPLRVGEQRHEPETESGAPPGGDAYTARG